MKARWNYSFSNLGPKKQISGTTYYKVMIGKEARWLSMEGIHMVEKAHQAGVNKGTVMKATSFYTGRGTRLRIAKMRRRISSELGSLMGISPEDFERLRKGLSRMTALSNNEILMERMDKLLSVMTEAELRQFWKENQLLLDKFFTDSDKLRGTPATADETEVGAVEANIERNAVKVLMRMEELVSRRLGKV